MPNPNFRQRTWFRYPLLLVHLSRWWWWGYLQYLAKMLFNYPTFFFRNVTTWIHYLFFVRLTRPPFPSPPVLTCNDVEQAVQVFNRYGFVVLEDALTPQEAETLRQIVNLKADEIVRRHQHGALSEELLHGKNRYSFAEYGHSPEWEYLAHNKKILPIIKAIWKGRDFRAVAAGGDFVFPGGTWQHLHSDDSWEGAGDLLPRAIVANYYVSEVLPNCGPLRQIAGTARFPVPNHMVDIYEPAWMQKSIITGRAGYAILRDYRGWHGGTPNTSSAPRYMPNLEYVLSDLQGALPTGDAIRAQLTEGKWIADFKNSETGDPN